MLQKVGPFSAMFASSYRDYQWYQKLGLFNSIALQLFHFGEISVIFVWAIISCSLLFNGLVYTKTEEYNRTRLRDMFALI